MNKYERNDQDVVRPFINKKERKEKKTEIYTLCTFMYIDTFMYIICNNV